MNPWAACYSNVTIMPRYKEPFTIFPRKLKSGKTVYYYRTYSPDGERTVPRSTGLTNKTQARNYCSELYAAGMLYCGTGISFGAYASNFFDDGEEWMCDKIQTSNGKEQPVAKSTLKAYRHNTKDVLIPYFSKIKLADLKPRHIKSFRDKMIKEGKSNATINLACACLKIIISYAIANKLMTFNPFSSVSQMYTDARKRKAFTLDEMKDILKSDWDSAERRAFAITAAVTGMRISEICAIRKETLHEDYIDIKDQYLNNEFAPVKDGERRKVRICKELHTLLAWCIKKNDGMAFDEDKDTYRTEFYRKTGLTHEQRVQKGLSFHSIRRFVNTYLLSKGLPEIKVKCVLGHSSGKGSMTERYANFQPSDFDDFAEIQRNLMSEFY